VIHALTRLLELARKARPPKLRDNEKWNGPAPITVPLSPELVAALSKFALAAESLREWAVEFEDPRVKYLSVQVNRIDVEEFDKALDELRRAVGGET